MLYGVGTEDDDHLVPQSLRFHRRGDVPNGLIGEIYHCVVDLPVVSRLVCLFHEGELVQEVLWNLERRVNLRHGWHL